MSKCIEFVKNRIKECNIKIPLDDTVTFTEMKFNEFVSNDNKLMKRAIECIKDNNNIEMKYEGVRWEDEINDINITNLISYDENADFEYITMEQCVCDGTLSFLNDVINKLFEKILFAETVNKQKIPSDFCTKPCDYEINYTIGNFVICTEHGNFGTEEKPWLNTRFTVLLPIKFDIKEKERQTNEN